MSDIKVVASSTPSTFRLVSSEDHYLAISADYQQDALNRWNEFYPSVNPETVTVSKVR